MRLAALNHKTEKLLGYSMMGKEESTDLTNKSDIVVNGKDR